MSGLTAEGLVIETADEIRASINAELITEFGPQQDLTDGSLEGIVIGIISDHLALGWEALQAIHDARNPNAATGAALVQICALTGVQQQAARATEVALVLTGADTTVVNADSQVAITGAPDLLFATDENATIAAVPAWAAITAYVVGNRVCVSGVRVYFCTTAGTTGASPPIVDDFNDGPSNGGAGTAYFRFLGFGVGAADVTATATETGPIVAVAGSIQAIVTPVSGWESVVNADDAAVGADIESDEHLRLRRVAELSAAGTTPTDALRADLLQVGDGTANPVTSVRMFVNLTGATDGDGVPARSFEALILGGEDQDLWDEIYAAGPIGIQSHGTEIGTATDSQGFTHSVAFSRPVEVDIYVDVVLVKNVTATAGATYPSDGDDQVKAAVVAFGNALGVGRDVVATQLISAIYAIAGVTSVSVPEIDDAAAPATTATVVITDRQIARFDVARTTVATSNGTF